VGEGPTGNAYAISTKDKQLQVLPLAEIRVSIAGFLEYAREHREKNFFVTAVGTQLAVSWSSLFGHFDQRNVMLLGCR